MSDDWWLLERRVKENYVYTWTFLEGFKELDLNRIYGFGKITKGQKGCL